MNYTDKSVAISTIPKLCANGTYNFTHPLQRSSGQWNKQQKSDLIDSLFRNFHIDAVSLAKDGKKFYVIDGIQRLSTIKDFVNGSLRLSVNLKELPDGGSKTTNEREMAITMYDVNNPEDTTREEAIGMEYYKHYNTSGTASRDNVNGRWKVFKSFYKK